MTVPARHALMAGSALISRTGFLANAPRRPRERLAIRVILTTLFCSTSLPLPLPPLPPFWSAPVGAHSLQRLFFLLAFVVRYFIVWYAAGDTFAGGSCNVRELSVL